jgi:hypothetical protein
MAGVFTLFSAGAFRAMAQEVFPRPSNGGYESDAATALLFKLNEGAGETAVDASPYGNDGTVQGASWTKGRYAGGLHFDGINDRVRVNDAPNLRLSSALTLEAWVKPGNDRRGIGTILAKRRSYALAVVESPTMRAAGAIWRGGSAERIVSRAELAPDRWQHLALLFDGIRLAIVVNGAVDRVRTLAPGAVDTNANPVLLGVYWKPPGQNWFCGDMDEVRLSNVARDPAELDPNQG